MYIFVPAVKRTLCNVIRQNATIGYHLGRSLVKVPARPETALSWVIREVLAEPQPAAAWVVHIIGTTGASDDRNFTIIHSVDDPTQAYQRDGLPGRILEPILPLTLTVI